MKITELTTEEKVRLDPKCWKGKKIGNPKTKMKGGVRVNNCVPAESVDEASLATMRDYFAGDKNAEDPTASAQQRDYFSKNDNSKPAVTKKFRSKAEYEQWLAQQKNKKAFKVTEEELDEIDRRGFLKGLGAAAGLGGLHYYDLTKPVANGKLPADPVVFYLIWYISFIAETEGFDDMVDPEFSRYYKNVTSLTDETDMIIQSSNDKLASVLYNAKMKGVDDADAFKKILWRKYPGSLGAKYSKNWPKGFLEELNKNVKQHYDRLKSILAQKKESVSEGVIIGPSETGDPMDPQVAVLGGAGSYSLKGLYNKAQRESAQLTKDIGLGNFRSSSHNVKQLANTLNTIVAAHNELEAIRKGGGPNSRGIERGVDYKE